jgi:mycofactocin system transcriptional regulator
VSQNWVNGQGRPPVTSHAAIENAAFELFDVRGFELTTLDDIAAHMGIGRRTIFRYFPSKFDIPWGQFDENLVNFGEKLNSTSVEVPLWQAIQESVLDFNTFDQGVLGQHRQRMRLILTTPSLQAHSFLMYQRWRGVITEFVAHRTNQPVKSAFSITVGYVSLALALSAYDIWLASEEISLREALSSSLACLQQHISL